MLCETLGDTKKSMAQNGRLDCHPAQVAVQTAILCHTFLCVSQGNQSMRNSSVEGSTLESAFVFVVLIQCSLITDCDFGDEMKFCFLFVLICFTLWKLEHKRCQVLPSEAIHFNVS